MLSKQYNEEFNGGKHYRPVSGIGSIEGDDGTVAVLRRSKTEMPFGLFKTHRPLVELEEESQSSLNLWRKMGQALDAGDAGTSALKAICPLDEIV